MVTDIDMPSMDGIELLRTLRGDPAPSSLPIVVVSCARRRGGSAQGDLRQAPTRTSSRVSSTSRHCLDTVHRLTRRDEQLDGNYQDPCLRGLRDVRPGPDRFLEHQGGIEVIRVCATGEETLRSVSRLAPDLVTMDLQLPGMSGLRTIEAMMRVHAVPIVVLSVDAARRSENACRGAGGRRAGGTRQGTGATRRARRAVRDRAASPTQATRAGVGSTRA